MFTWCSALWDETGSELLVQLGCGGTALTDSLLQLSFIAAVSWSMQWGRQGLRGPGIKLCNSPKRFTFSRKNKHLKTSKGSSSTRGGNKLGPNNNILATDKQEQKSQLKLLNY